MPQFKQDFSPLSIEAIHDTAAARKAEGFRYVQTLAVNTEDGVDLVYSFMKDGRLDNEVASGVPRDAVIPSITDLYLEAFVFENEIHDLFGVRFEGIAIDFGGNFYHLAVKEPMTIISPEQKAARDKARKIAAAKAAKEAKAKKAAEQGGAEAPAKAEAEKAETAADAAAKEAELEAKLAAMDPEKAAKVRAAMEAKAKKAAAAERKGE
ncbi:NADH-quinone oxidoreductase subunit C [Adlercreutzia sp. ZJ242]|uniref:NADH-quinone oxidoreductase subunit C n=1 Tax=Adlercreutzia sp. ZJ242 TaxID=2709409 RepID=UPI0013EAF02A|nr:NADH-quinone oxidoreductase subunit C [Adlercreutzia sp. ZJ242]